MTYKDVIIIGLLIIILITKLSVIGEKGINESVDYTLPETRLIKKSLSFSGKIVPNKEISITSNLSGTLIKHYYTVGDKVRKGKRISKINITINPFQYSDLKNEVEIAKLNFDHTQKNHEINKNLYDKDLIPLLDYMNSEKNLKAAKQAVDNYNNKLLLVDDINPIGKENDILAPISGTIMSLDIKEGGTVMGRSDFNEGNIIAKIGDMNNLHFKGMLTDKEVFNLQKGSIFNIKLAAIPKEVFNSTVLSISPIPTIMANGNPRFEVLAKIELPEEYKNRIYSGFNAVAELTIAEKSVLSIEENCLIFRNDSTFVQIRDKDEIKMQPVSLGISNGIYAEIISGLSEQSQIICEDLSDY